MHVDYQLKEKVMFLCMARKDEVQHCMGIMGLTTEDNKMITIKVHGDQIVDAGQNLHIQGLDDDEEIYMTI